MRRSPALALVLLLVACVGPGAGPLRADPDKRTMTSMPADPREAVSWANNHVGAAGLTVTIDEVSLVDADEGLRIVGVAMIPDSGASVSTGSVFPPTVPFATLPVAITGSYRVVIGVSADEAGEYVATGLDFCYHIGDLRFAAHYPTGVKLCVGAETCYE